VTQVDELDEDERTLTQLKLKRIGGIIWHDVLGTNHSKAWSI